LETAPTLAKPGPWRLETAPTLAKPGLGRLETAPTLAKSPCGDSDSDQPTQVGFTAVARPLAVGNRAYACQVALRRLRPAHAGGLCRL